MRCEDEDRWDKVTCELLRCEEVFLSLHCRRAVVHKVQPPFEEVSFKGGQV